MGVVFQRPVEKTEALVRHIARGGEVRLRVSKIPFGRDKIEKTSKKSIAWNQWIS